MLWNALDDQVDIEDHQGSECIEILEYPSDIETQISRRESFALSYTARGDLRLEQEDKRHRLPGIEFVDSEDE